MNELTRRDDLASLVAESALVALGDEQPKRITILRGFAAQSRDYATDVRDELRSRGAEASVMPLAVASWAPPDDGPDDQSRGLLIDATQTYPLSAAQYAAVTRKPLLTLVDDRQRGYAAAQPALFLGYEITPGPTSTEVATHMILVEDVAIQQVVIEVTGGTPIETRSRDLSEVVDPERASDDRTSITMTHDSTLVLQCDLELVKATLTSGGVRYTWWTDEIAVEAVDGNQVVRFDNSEHLGIAGCLTIGRLDRLPLRATRSLS